MQTNTKANQILVLGGTGFIGAEVCRLVLRLGYNVVAVSRRGKPLIAQDDTELASVDWHVGNAIEEGVIEGIVSSKGPFKAVIHAIGALFDGQSGLKALNCLTSASGSVPDEKTSYDDITRRTALALLSATQKHCPPGTPFIFISAAEAGWPQKRCGSIVEKFGPRWLKRYLSAKRAVETEVLNSMHVRGVVMRPSFVWTWRKIDILLPVAIYTVGSALGIPFMDRPVHLQTIACALVEALERDDVRGVQDFRGMDILAAAFSQRLVDSKKA